jgi:hypothetical protein
MNWPTDPNQDNTIFYLGVYGHQHRLPTMDDHGFGEDHEGFLLVWNKGCTRREVFSHLV